MKYQIWEVISPCGYCIRLAMELLEQQREIRKLRFSKLSLLEKEVWEIARQLLSLKSKISSPVRRLKWRLRD
jgi:hypothetical protein